MKTQCQTIRLTGALAAILAVSALASGPAAAQTITEIIDATGDGAGNVLNGPRLIAVDAAGNAYVTGFDSDNAFKITPCPGDANGDGAVDPLDSGFVLARFGCPVGTGDPGCDTADQNGDGFVDPLDVGFILARFGPCP